MEVKIDKLILPIFHKTKMGDMNLLWDYGNSLRIINGKKPLDLDHYLRSKETLEFIIELEKDFNSADSALLKLEVNSKRGTAKIIGGKLTTIITKKGRFAHLYILLDMATKLDPAFKVQVYKTFIEGQILQHRDNGGESFNFLNVAIDKFLPTSKVIGENKSLYCDAALKIRKIVGLDNGLAWNKASNEQLEHRDKLLIEIVTFLERGFIKNDKALLENIS